MKKRVFISRFLLMLFAATLHISVAVPEPDLDLPTLIAGIKHFDAAVISGKGEFVYEHKIGPDVEKQTYALTFDGTTFEEAQVRVDFSKGTDLTDICDGERHWKVVERKSPLFRVDITPADYELLNKGSPELPHPVKQKFKEIGINFSDDFRIETEEEGPFSKWIDNITEDSYYIYPTEEYVWVYTPQIGYMVDSGCGIDPHLDPRYWMTYGLATPTSYLMTPLWRVLEKYESEILQIEMLNGEETYLVSVQAPRGQPLKLWICPEKGFRLVKLQTMFEHLSESDMLPFKKGVHYFKERVLHYREYQPGIWFPEKVEETLHPLVAEDPENREDLIGKTTLQSSGAFQLNLDVSSNEFQLDIPDETLIFDSVLGKGRPFRELKETSQ